VTHHAEAIAGSLLGAAVGDALGLPREGMSRRRAEKMFGSRPVRHHFFFGRGMLSDDTEHTCMVGQSLLAAPDDPRKFALSGLAPAMVASRAARGSGIRNPACASQALGRDITRS
jgi:ADP-ribosylglycohydrolase